MGKNFKRHLSKRDIDMANKHMKVCSTSYVIMAIHTKTIMRCHYMPIRVANIWDTDNTDCWRGTGICIHCWSEKTVHNVFTKWNII